MFTNDSRVRVSEGFGRLGRLLCALLVIALCSMGDAAAVPLPVANSSFEADDVCNGCSSSSITGWNESPGGGDGVLDPSASDYPGGVVPDGDQVAYVNLPGNHVWQVLPSVLLANRTYTLQVEIGNRLDTPFAGYSIELRAGGVILAADSSSALPADGEFETATLQYVSSNLDGQLGEALEIWLLAPGVQANFDHVRLDESTPDGLVENPSFEADSLCDGCLESQPMGWTATAGGGDGALNPTPSQYPGGSAPDGDNVGYVNLPGNHLNQVTTELLQAQFQYCLQVEVGNRLDTAFAGYSVQLVAGGEVLAEDTSSVSPADGMFETAGVCFLAAADDPRLGEPVEIRLLAPGVQANFDDVRLTVSQVLFADGFESGDLSAWSAFVP